MKLPSIRLNGGSADVDGYLFLNVRCCNKTC